MTLQRSRFLTVSRALRILLSAALAGGMADLSLTGEEQATPQASDPLAVSDPAQQAVADETQDEGLGEIDATEINNEDGGDAESENEALGEEAPVAPVEQQWPERLEDGTVRFNFQGQPWLDVLKWLADSSELNLDWQEVPEGVLNLSTQESYTLEEALDVINMHLAARGFTLLRRGEVLSLVKLAELNPVLAPRVQPEDLGERGAHEYVRVSFPLEWLVAEAAASEFQPMLSPYGKLLPMKVTNRLEAIDAAKNLREIQALLEREQSGQSEERLLQEFTLMHAAAQDVVEKLQGLMGLDNAAEMRTRDRMRIQVEQTKANAELAKHLGQDAAKLGQGGQNVSLVVNERRNSILATAPPDKLAIIRQAIAALDIPEPDLDADAVLQMRVYRVGSFEPDDAKDLIESLRDSGRFEKTTHVEADDDGHRLIVYATPADHLAIAGLVEEFEGTERRASIIPLRRLDPAYAKQAIAAILQGEAEQGRRGRWGRDRSSDRLRIEADPEHRRLLLWANESEREEVKSLLAELGEDLHGAALSDSIRVLDVPARDAQPILEHLENVWPKLRKNPLRVLRPRRPRLGGSARSERPRVIIHDARTANAAGRGLGIRAGQAAGQPDEQRNDRPIKTTAYHYPRQPDLNPRQPDLNARQPGLNQAEASVELEAESEKTLMARASAQRQADDAPEPPPDEDEPAVVVSQGSDGRIIISSEDAEALDQLQSLLEGASAAGPEFHVFRLRHASPFAVQMTIEQVMGLAAQPTGDRRDDNTASTLPQLPSARPELVADLDTGTLLVKHADDEQLALIEELIQLYDKPESLDPELQRRTEIYSVRHSRAGTIVDVVKDVYRDLLSSNDREFSRERGRENNPSRDLGYGANYESKIPRFKGLLSIGVQENVNAIVVSAPDFLMDEVLEIIRMIDESAGDQVHKVLALERVSTRSLVEALSNIPGVTVNSTPAGQSGTATPSRAPPEERTSRTAGPRSSRPRSERD